MMGAGSDDHAGDTTRKQVLIVDDHPMLRAGLRQLIDSERDLIVCAEAGDAHQALEALKKHPVDLAVIDMLLDESTGVQLARSLRAARADLPIVALSMTRERPYVVKAFRAGILGWVTKKDAAEEILSAIREVLAGRIYLSRELVQTLPAQMIDDIVTGSLGEATSE
jgi:DNA-binding NarL/FixJ family response regulator